MKNKNSSFCFKFALVTLSLIWLQEGLAHQKISKNGCEGTNLEIECEPGTSINLIRANFGRFSISICNPMGNTTWSVNCLQPRTLRIIKSRCNSKSRCEIPVDKAIFGDPCPGTHKYVEVHYTCEPVKSTKTTTKSVPPWLFDLAATPASVPAETTTRTTTTTTPTTTTSSLTLTSTKAKSSATTEPSLSTEASPASVGSVSSTQGLNKEQPEPTFGTYEVTVFKDMLNHCPPLSIRNLFWNWTKNGDEAVQVCPPGSNGFAKWKCGHNSKWASENPNLGECQSQWLTRLESDMQIGSMDSISSKLAALTESKSLYGGDIPIVTSILQGLADKLNQEILIITSQDEEEQRVSETLQNVLKTASNLLDASQDLAWKDLPDAKRSAFASKLLLGIEENALLLAEVINDERNMIEATNNILASIRVMRSRDVVTQTFPYLETVRWEDDTLIKVPAPSLIEANVNGAVRIIFYLYKNLESILPGKGNKFVNSKIAGISVAKRKYLKLNTPVHFTLKHLQTKNIGNTVCATWNYSSRQWSSKDCSVLVTNATHTMCKCRRMSNYVILSEDVPEAAAEPHAASENALASHLSTIIACIVAIVLSVILVIIILVLIKRFDLKPRVQKFVQANGVFRCKKSESTTSSCGFYPPLTSSPTSTTVSSGTPTNQTYLEQVLKAHNSEFHQVNKPNTAMPQAPPEKTSSIDKPRGLYRATGNLNHPVSSASTNGRHLVALNQYDPYGHHIYMEIDPIYAHLDNVAVANSDIHLSDISDDDLRHRNQRLAEERPLIRHNLVNYNNPQDPRPFLTAHRMPRERPSLTNNNSFAGSSQPGNNSLRSARTLHQQHHKVRPRIGQQPLLYPVVASNNLEAPITIALQGGEQFVSLKIDKQENNEHFQHQQQLYH